MSDYNYEIQTLVQCVAVSRFFLRLLLWDTKYIYNYSEEIDHTTSFNNRAILLNNILL